MPQIARNAEHDLCKLSVAFERPLSIEVEVSVALRVPATARWCAVSGAVFRKCLVVRATRSFAVVVVLSTIDVTVLETVVFGSKMRANGVLEHRHCGQDVLMSDDRVDRDSHENVFAEDNDVVAHTVAVNLFPSATAKNTVRNVAQDGVSSAAFEAGKRDGFVRTDLEDAACAETLSAFGCC
jgi:hypothetical protein